MINENTLDFHSKERQGCAFLDAEGKAELNTKDCMHLTRKGHRQLAEVLAGIVPELLG